MQKPNFFIIGAPKCGTTSMAEWLSAHPNIYLSPIKEPNYFNTDDRWTMTHTQQQYESLFKKAGKAHQAIGEASAWYLYSQKAVPNILRYTNNPKFIVMLRNPLEMVYSLHQQEVYSGNEPITDFALAWSLQEKRAAGVEVSRQVIEVRRLLYGPACQLGEQLVRLYQQAKKENVLVLLLDDVKQCAQSEYVKVLDFLGVPNDDRVEFPVFNLAKAHRSRWVGRTIAVIGRTARRAKLAVGVHGGLGVLDRLAHANTVKQARSVVDSKTTMLLLDYFHEDIIKLSQLLQRDLSHWLKIEGIAPARKHNDE